MLPLRLDNRDMLLDPLGAFLNNLGLDQYLRRSHQQATRSLSLMLPSAPSLRVVYRQGTETQGMRDFLSLAAERGIVVFESTAWAQLLPWTYSSTEYRLSHSGPAGTAVSSPLTAPDVTSPIRTPLATRRLRSQLTLFHAAHIPPPPSEIAELTTGEPLEPSLERHIPPTDNLAVPSPPVPTSLFDPPSSETPPPQQVTIDFTLFTPPPEPLTVLPSNDSPALAEPPSEELVPEPSASDVVTTFEPTLEPTEHTAERDTSAEDSSVDQEAPSNEHAAGELPSVGLTDEEVKESESGAAGGSLVEEGGSGKRAGSEGLKM